MSAAEGNEPFQRGERIMIHYECSFIRQFTLNFAYFKNVFCLETYEKHIEECKGGCKAFEERAFKDPVWARSLRDQGPDWHIDQLYQRFAPICMPGRDLLHSGFRDKNGDLVYYMVDCWPGDPDWKEPEEEPEDVVPEEISYEEVEITCSYAKGIIEDPETHEELWDLLFKHTAKCPTCNEEAWKRRNAFFDICTQQMDRRPHWKRQYTSHTFGCEVATDITNHPAGYLKRIDLLDFFEDHIQECTSCKIYSCR